MKPSIFAATALFWLAACGSPPRESTVSVVRVETPTQPSSATKGSTSNMANEAAPASSSTPSLVASSVVPSGATDGAPPDEWIRNEEPVVAATDEDVAGLPEKLVQDNIRSTPVTVLAHVTSGKVWRNPEHPRDMYVNHVYQAEVLEVFRGSVASKITYSVMAERDIPLRMPAYPIVLSLCGRDPDQYFVPDNGYEFPAAPRVLREARMCAKRKSTHTHPATACD